MGLGRGARAPAHRRDGEDDHEHRGSNPVALFLRWVDWFERRGVYTPGADSRPLSAWRDFSWWITAWLITVGVLVVVLASAG